MGPDPDATPTWCIFAHDYPARSGGGMASWVRDLMNLKGRAVTGLAQLQLVFVQQGRYVPFHAGHGVTITDGSDGQAERWQAYMATVPKRRFDRKRRRLAITLRGDPALDFREGGLLGDISVADIRIGTAMVLQALRYAETTLNPADGVSLAPLITAAEGLLQRQWADDADLRAELTHAYQLERGRIEEMDPWAKLDLRGTHKDARAVLDHPSDWSEGNDFAPHGNDLGADIWADWKRVKLRSVDVIAGDYCVSVLGAWGEVQLMLALAFGHVKKTGTCAADLAQAALSTLQDKAQAAEAQIAPQHVAAFRAAVSRYGGILARFADPAGH